MKLAVPLAAALLAGSCAEPQPVRVSPAASKALGAPDEACRTASAEVPSFAEGGSGTRPAEPEGLPPEPAASQAPRPVFQGKPLLPPERPGESVFEVQGCLAAAEHTAAAGARHPQPPDRPEDAVRVTPLSSGLIVTHEMAHPCCLRAAVAASVEGAAVQVSETLSGSPCACRCASRLRTAIALAPGRYSVSVVVRGPGSGEERTAWSGETALPGR
ncbi:MAG TPA: hypothetical protein VIG99_15060 [Myxococcaceae bacterium]